MKIVIETVAKNKMRYATAGDWFYSAKGTLKIQVSDEVAEGNDQFLTALHELVEAYLCGKRDISQRAVDEFDMAYERAGRLGEPGDDPHAPYRKEHRFSCLIEHLVAHELGMEDYGVVE